MKANTFVYTGCENLEAMLEARNYNNYLTGIVTGNIKGKKLKVLDFGAGTGTYADMLKEQGVIADCLEPDKKLQTVLKRKGYKIVDSTKALKPKSYDVIYALNVFEHLEDDTSIFAELRKALSKQGVIIIYVPAFQSLYSSMDKLVGHHRRYKKAHLKQMAQDNNMQIIKLKYCDPIGYMAALIYKFAGRTSGVLSPGSVKLYDRIAFPISRLAEPFFMHLFGKNVLLVAQNNEK